MSKNNSRALYRQSMIMFFSFVMLFSTSVLSRTLIFQSGQDAGTTSTTTKGNVISAQAGSLNSGISSKAGSTPVSDTASLSANSELFFMIEQLQQEVNTLRGMVEEQGYELRMLKQSGKDRYLDLDTRILDLTKRLSVSSSRAVSSGDSVPASQLVSTPGELPKAIKEAPKPVVEPIREPSKVENDDYQKAYALIKDKKFDESIIALFNYTEKHPESPLLPNVYYWLGEVYLATSKLEQAKMSFSLVVTAYPSSQKTPDALYKLGVTVHRLGDVSLAKQYISDVQSKFPDTTAAKLAAGYKIQ